MPVGALGAKRDDHLRPVAAKHAHDVAQKTCPSRIDFLYFLEGAIRIVKDFKKTNPKFSCGVAKLESANVRELAKIAGGPTIPEAGAAAGHGDQADRRALGTVARDRRRAAETLVVRMRHHHHQALAVTLHVRTIMNGCQHAASPAAPEGRSRPAAWSTGGPREDPRSR